MAMRYNDPKWGDIEIVTDKYRNNGALAVVLVTCIDGQLLTDLSKNLNGASLLPEGCFYAKTYSENEEIAKVALQSGWFDEMGGSVRSGGVELPIWKLRATRKQIGDQQ